MKIASYNLNGIRAAVTKGLIGWLQKQKLDIVCFQELKANLEDIPTELFEALGYHCYWFPAQKKGYSGVGIITKIQPSTVVNGCGKTRADFEGRIIKAVFPEFTLINTYFPSGSSGTEKQDYKMEFLSDYQPFITEALQESPELIVVGDYNICHNAIDIHDPKGNKNSSGFLPEEREWMDEFFEIGFVDSFRTINPHPHQYSWWSYRAGARANNKGWRIDYISVSHQLKNTITDSYLIPDALHSDHCPVVTEFKF